MGWIILFAIIDCLVPKSIDIHVVIKGALIKKIKIKSTKTMIPKINC